MDDDVRVTFDAAGVDLPEEFRPDESVLQQRSTFEQLLDRVVDTGTDKQTAVAEINRLQAELAISIEAAAALYARRQGVDVENLAGRAAREL